jgi:transcriptional regulator with XRE-family HTH domain
MRAADFKAWRKTMGYTQKQAAEALGLGTSTIEQYDRGVRKDDGTTVTIPLTVALACAALAAGLRPWQATA